MKTIVSFFYFSIVICLCSCYSPRYVYRPVAHNVPVLIKKGDSKIAFNLSAGLPAKFTGDSVVKGDKNTGFDLQVAYAISNHFALQAGYARRTEKNFGDYSGGNFDSSFINYKSSSTEFGIGYYASLYNNSQTVFQVFAGVGMGTFQFTDHGKDLSSKVYDRFHQIHATKIYIQPAIITGAKRGFAASLATGFSVIYFSKAKTDYTNAELDNYQLNDLGKNPVIFWEPAMVNTFGLKKLPGLRLELQVNMAFLVSGRLVNYRTFNVSGGIVLDIPKLFSRQPPGL